MRAGLRSERRELFIDVTWQLIVSEGLAAVTLRRVAELAGYTNGALKPYFASKSALMEAAYLRAFENTELRTVRSVAGHTGIEALRRVCLELLPLDEERRMEARVVVAFWEQAVTDKPTAALFQHHMNTWTGQIEELLEEGRASGEIVTEESNRTIVDELLWTAMGAQALSLLAPESCSPRRQRVLLERQLESLTVPAGAPTGLVAR